MAARPNYSGVSFDVTPGLYRHYKGGMYVVLDIAHHSETEEALVIYHALGAKEIWARPYSMFCENVFVAGRFMPRFERVGEASDLDNSTGDYRLRA